MERYIEFVGENLDVYRIPDSYIVSFTINGLDYKDFIKGKEKKIYSYKLITKESIRSFLTCKCSAPYIWRDFVSLYIYTNKEYKYEIEWLGENELYSYAQDIRRNDGLWVYTHDMSLKPSYFKTCEIELLIKEKLNMHFNDILTKEDISKVDKLYIDEYRIRYLNSDHYEDIEKLYNLEELEIDFCYVQLDINRLRNNNLKKLWLRGYNKKKIKKINGLENLEKVYYEYSNEEELEEDDYSRIKNYLCEVMKLGLINEEEYQEEFNRGLKEMEENGHDKQRCCIKRS